jgi:Tfp pilus assembly protein PilN
MNAVTLSTHGNKVQIDETIHNFRLAEKIQAGKKHPVTLVITGKKVLIKKVAGPVTGNALEMILPQANPDEFYIQTTKEQDFTIIAVIRRSVIDDLVKEFESSGYSILNIHLGFSIVNSIARFITIETGHSLLLGPYSLQVNSGGISNFEVNWNTTEPIIHEYLVINQYIQGTHVLPYAAAISLMTDQLEDRAAIDSTFLDMNREEFRYKKYFSAAGVSFAGLLLLLLLINFLLFDHYYAKNKEIAALQSVTKQETEQMQHINNEVAIKERFLISSGWLKPVRTSFYADRLAGLLPNDVWLTNLQFYPLRTSGFSDAGDYHFKKDTIVLTGNCTDAGLVNIFINNLKTIKTIKDVSMKQYISVREEDTGQFTLEITTQ